MYTNVTFTPGQLNQIWLSGQGQVYSSNPSLTMYHYLRDVLPYVHHIFINRHTLYSYQTNAQLKDTTVDSTALYCLVYRVCSWFVHINSRRF